ncbi:sensor histidine kinase [Fusobacterium necrophorum]|uniref:Sensor histidine kinase n=1 Tax=Fusobacterium necrophorum TaxID=859 RepID=A0A4Q2L4F5_9FUSO|nr:histidine kinase [Fusobacterium necrophorum]RXZ71011.1 sensor histidine kinase [Fusobacterium necrophorum]
MKESYLQHYLNENYMLLAMVIGTYFVVAMKSAVDTFIKKRMILSMTLLFLLSMAEFYIQYFRKQPVEGLVPIGISIIYYVLKPMIMIFVIKILEQKNKLFYIPSIVNLIFCYAILTENSLVYVAPERRLEFVEYISVAVEWIYWIIFLFVLNIKLYQRKELNHLGLFFCITILMIASIIDSINSRGILLEIYALAFLFYYLVIHVYISQRVNEEKEIKLREQRVSLMLSQIQPHFLYNTLNTITALCRVNPKLAEETTVKFSKYLRENMYSMGENEIHPFLQELEHTNIYLDIEKLRFGDRVKVEYNITSEDFSMPTLTLQPIVENAVKHGICKKVGGGTIKISTEKKGKAHIITIADNGVGFEPEEIFHDENPHIGIQNVKERLKSMVNAEIEITSFLGIGTIVKIIIPGEQESIKQERRERREILSIGR